MFGAEAAIEAAVEAVADRPFVPADYRSTPRLYNEYRIKKTNVVLPDGKPVKVVFPNAESENRPIGSNELAALNALTHLYENSAFKAAPNGIYIYGFFDTGFGALQVRSAVEFLTGHNILARRMKANKVYAAGELEKTEPTKVDFNLTTGTYKHIELKIAQKDLNDFVIAEFARIGITAKVSIKKPTPASYIDDLLVLNANEQKRLTNHGFTLVNRRRAARRRRTTCRRK